VVEGIAESSIIIGDDEPVENNIIRENIFYAANTSVSARVNSYELLLAIYVAALPKNSHL
jgi:hypothetical protein